jgi:CheY-like chemotaxis protein
MAHTAAGALRILIAEDETSVVQSVSVVLRYAGHRIESVTNGTDALALLTAKSADYDLLITDHTMPAPDGLQLVGKLRATNYSGKIIVLSAHLTSDVEQAYRALAVDHILRKPFDIAELRAAVEQATAAIVAQRSV